MYGSLDVAVSGMIAQRTRMEVATANIANIGACTFGANGEPEAFQKRIVLFAPGDPGAQTTDGRAMGVHVAGIALDDTPAGPGEYDPSSPYAFKSGPNKGRVPASNVNPIVEQVNLLDAQRAYEANEVAAETTDAEPAAFFAVTRTRSVLPTSAEPSLYVFAVAPITFAQLAPALSQRRHWYENDIGWKPVQTPVLATTCCSTLNFPEITGSAWL